MTRLAPTNPFSFGALALEDAFTDRVAEVAELGSDVLNGQDVVIFAPRRYGKTSLVRRVCEGAQTQRVLVAEVNLMATPTKEKLAGRLAEVIHDHLLSTAAKAKDHGTRFLAGLRIRPTVTLDPDTGKLGFTFAAGHVAQDVDDTLQRLLELLAEIATERDRRVVLVLDEFQEVMTIDPKLPRLMRSVFQEQPQVAHVYLGSKRHMMRQIFSDENEPFWRSAKSIELDVIAPELFGDFITDRFAQTGKAIEPGVALQLARATGGHPYATQELAYFAWEATPADVTADGEVARFALAQAMRAEHAHLSGVWEAATANQRQLLAALAREPGHPQQQAYRARHALKSSSLTQKALDALVRDDVVRKKAGFAWIAEPFLAEWIVDSGA